MATNNRKTNTSKSIMILFCLLIAGGLLIGLQGALAAPAAQTKEGSDSPSGIYRGESTAVKFDVSPPLSQIAPVQISGSQGKEIPELPTGLEGAFGPQDVDPLVQSVIGAGEIPAPSVSFNGPSNIAGVSPPDPVGDVGLNHYVVMSNLYFQIFDKAGNSLYGPAANNTLWAGFGGPCQNENAGDPIVLYDQLSDRWILTQFTASGPTYYNCVAVSTTGNPTGTYYRYAFSTGTNFPDYPKYGIWPDALYISTREFNTTFVGIGAYAINRAELLAGNPTPSVISFLVTPASAGGAFNIGDGLLPSDLDGTTLPQPGSPNYFVGSMDDGGPYGAPLDALTLWKFSVNFANPAASSFFLSNIIPIAAYDTIFPCSPNIRDCIPQPGTSNKVDILSYRQRPTWRLAYRNFGTHESLVTNQTVEAGPGIAGIRWWEIRSPNSSPVIYQEGTYAPGLSDSIHRWMGSIAMDSAGNMALGYSASNATTTYPSVWYTGRLSSDPLGTMPQGEASIVDGTGSQTSSMRWGDYTSMNVDPVDDRTFWYVNQWVPVTSSNGWQIRIGAFSIPDIADFHLTSTPTHQAVCKPGEANYDISVGSLLGFNDPVTLSSLGEPAGATTSFMLNPVSPPGNSLFTIGNTGAAASGSYTITVSGFAPNSDHSIDVFLDLFDTPPGKAALVAPANFAANQPLQPDFSWAPTGQAESYALEIATDSQFNTIVYTATNLIAPNHTPGAALNPFTVYYWRVRSSNACGAGEASDPFVFVTQNAAVACPVGTLESLLFSDDFESGAPGWTHSGTGDTWALSTGNPHSGSSAFHANDPSTVSDQRLVSPAVVLPSGQDPLTLSFWNWQHMETQGTTGCFDGGILEVSTDGGLGWTQVPNTDLLTDPYNGLVSLNFSNPLAGLNAWCGNNPQPYLNSMVDVSAYAGQTAQFRFRLGSDTSVSRPGWDIDDVTVLSCQAGNLALLGLDKSQTALPESGLDYVFTLLNLGASDTFDLSLSGNAWHTTILGQSNVAVGAGAAVTVTVHVDVPPVEPDNLDVSDTFTLSALSNSDPSLTLQTSGTTRSQVTAGFLLAPFTQSQSGAPGSAVDHTYTISNTGSYTDTFSLSVAGNSWPTSVPASITLGAGQTSTFAVQVGIPPQAAQMDAIIVSDSFTLTVASRLDSVMSVQASGSTSTSANPALSLISDISSQKGTPGQSLVYNLLVTNNGDFPDSYDLSVSGIWGAALSAVNSGSLAPGESTSLQLTVTIPGNAAIGDRDITTVTASSTLDLALQESLRVTTSADNWHIYLPWAER